MTNSSDDNRAWKKIKEIIIVNLSVIFMLIIWLGLFISVLIGYFSIPLLIVVAVVTCLTIYERVVKRDKDEDETLQDSYYRDKRD